MKYKIVNFICKHIFLYKFFRQIYRFLCKSVDNNMVVLIKANGKKIINPKIKKLKIIFRGKNNYVEIKEPFKIQKELKIITTGSNNIIKIDSFSEILKTFIYVNEQNTVEIGKRFYAADVIITCATSKGKKIIIGCDCMFSYNVMLRVADCHTVYEINKHEILNPDADTTIGNHVWLAHKSLIMKGCNIPNNCIVGAGAIVTKKFSESNCIIAGVPAKITKRNVNWDKCVPSEFKERQKLL